VLIPAAREALTNIQRGIFDSQGFDPATTDRPFSIALSDVGEIVFLPRLSQVLARRAPATNVGALSFSRSELDHRLISGDVDLAIGCERRLPKSIGPTSPRDITPTSLMVLLWMRGRSRIAPLR
jgi:DNA-binding transcriptional LysR family regulator